MKNKISENKIIFIYGDKPIDGQQRDGEIYEIKKEKEDRIHYEYLCEYLEKNMLNNTEIQESKEKKGADAIFYQIQNEGTIGFAESTSRNAKQKNCIIYIPKKITDKQKESLNILKNALEEENYHLAVLFELSRDSKGVINGMQKMGKPYILNYFTEQKNNKKELNER